MVEQYIDIVKVTGSIPVGTTSYGNVAHQVEHRIENPSVAGSSPAVPTNAPMDKLVKSALSKGAVLSVRI